MSASASDAFYTCYKALHLVAREALPCVDNSLKTWHANQTIPPCTGQGKCPVGKKPKRPASCLSCEEWGKRIEAAVYHPLPKAGPPPALQQPAALSKISQKPSQLPWGNLNSSNLGGSHVEVAKAFVLRFPNKPQQSNSGAASKSVLRLEDFDSASLLMSMTRFRDFHGGDQASYEIIEKVSKTASKHLQ